MALATASPDGMPSVRIVLLKGIDDARRAVLHQLRLAQGPRAGREPARGGDAPLAAAAPRGARWRARSSGSTAEESDAYFASRGRGVAARRVGVEAGHADPDRAGARARRSPTPTPRYPGRGRPAAGVLGRLPARARRGRALAGPAGPAARPRALPARRGRRLALGAAVAVSWLGGPLDVDGLAVDAVRSALEAAAELAEARGLGRPAVSLSEEHVAVAFASERHARVRGEPAGAGFAPLSRMVRCRDGWARTHANYAAPRGGAAARARDRRRRRRSWRRPRRRCAPSSSRTRSSPRAAAPPRCAREAEWAAHPAGAALAGTSLVGMAGRGVRGPSRSRHARGRAAPAGAGAAPAAAARARPAAGLRVLDLTRVIAGPVAGRTLAALGAEVLRIDPPALPEMPEAHLDTGPGKRSALLDLADAERREALLAGADVLLTGYRPGSLDRFGLERRPGARARVAERVGDGGAVGAGGAASTRWSRSRAGSRRRAPRPTGRRGAPGAGARPRHRAPDGRGRAARPRRPRARRARPPRPALARPHRRRAARPPAPRRRRPARPDPDRFRVASATCR